MDSAEKEKRSTKEELMEVLSALKPEIDFTKETELIDEGLLESFDVITLIAELEDQFGVEIPAEDLQNLLTVGDVMKYLKDKGVE